MDNINKNNVIMPGGFEILKKAEKYLDINKNIKVLSVACGNGELECYIVEKYGCTLLGIDILDSFIKEAKKKAQDKKLEDKITFEIGNGQTIKYDNESFDLIFCSGAICAFFDEGIKEFYRLLKLNGKALISEVIFFKKEIPSYVRDFWIGTSNESKVLTLKNNCEEFEKHGFKVIVSEEYNEPEWWYKYEDARIKSGCDWATEEKEKYETHKDFIGVGLFVLEK